MFEKEISRKPLTRQVWSARDTPFEFFYTYILYCVGVGGLEYYEKHYFIYTKKEINVYRI